MAREMTNLDIKELKFKRFIVLPEDAVKFQTASGFHSASYAMGTGAFSPG
jgi:hypothetical protein